MTTPHLWFAVLAGAALAAVPAAAAAAKPAVYTVTLQQMAFGPLPARLRVGDTIEWVNNDIFVHSATTRDKAFDVELKPGAHLWTTFRKAGTFPFACRYHPGMTGTLVVTGQAR